MLTFQYEDIPIPKLKDNIELKLDISKRLENISGGDIETDGMVIVSWNMNG